MSSKCKFRLNSNNRFIIINFDKMSKVRFKRVAVSTRLSTFITNNADESVAVNRVEKFAVKYCLLVSNLDQYLDGVSLRGRVALVSFMKVILAINVLRFSISGLSRDRRVWALMGDANYILGNPFLISIMMSIGAFVILFIGLIIQIQEANHNMKPLEFFLSVKHRRLPLPLSAVHYRRIMLFFNLMSKYLMSQAFWPLIIVTNGFMGTATIIAYMDPNSGFTLLGVIFWSVMTFFWTVQFYALVSLGFVIIFVICLYLKFRFREITEEIKRHLNYRNSMLLIKTFKSHQDAAKLTSELNEFLKYVIFILYYFGTPGLEILAYLSHERNTTYYARFAGVFIFVIVFGVVFMII